MRNILGLNKKTDNYVKQYTVNSRIYLICSIQAQKHLADLHQEVNNNNLENNFYCWVPLDYDVC